ncbi:MAG: hypothetical protein MRJ93_13140 [Nitrososphaeraceae archaeon]|nr:hypothetical protein [Nitrososphaeraceae archaeon]
MNVIPFSFRIVFSNLSYIFIATVVAVVFWILFNTFDKLLFFSPVWTFYLPDDAVLGFILTNTSSILLGILISMNIYVIKQANLKVSKSSLLSGTTLGILSSTCASCSSIGFVIISTLGGTGIAISNFLEVYAIPLRIISILILLYALYLVHNKLTKSCLIH